MWSLGEDSKQWKGSFRFGFAKMFWEDNLAIHNYPYLLQFWQPQVQGSWTVVRSGPASSTESKVEEVPRYNTQPGPPPLVAATASTQVFGLGVPGGQWN